MIVGLDLALKCGWCLYDEVAGAPVRFGTQRIKAPLEGRKAEVRRAREAGRLHAFEDFLLDLAPPDTVRAVFFETPIFRAIRSLDHALSFGGLRAVVVQTYGSKLPVVELHAATVKKETTGHGRADKDAIAASVNRRWGLQLEPGDTADGIAVAFTGAVMIERGKVEGLAA